MPLPGWKFAGYRRGNCDRSVEGSIIEAVDKKHLGHGFRSAARSDRRVSALGNLFSIDSDLYPGRITGILNSSSLDIVFHHYANVGDGFDCRKCTSKQYTYAISRKSVDPDLFQTRAKMFARPHDYSSFCRKGGHHQEHRQGRSGRRRTAHPRRSERDRVNCISFHQHRRLWVPLGTCQ